MPVWNASPSEIRISPSDIPNLESIVGGGAQKSLVKHLWLAVDLPPFETLDPSQARGNSRDAASDHVIQSIANLFDALSTWDTRGLVLQISVHPVTETEDFAKDYRFESHQGDPKPTWVTPIHDQYHYWLQGEAPKAGAAAAVHGDIVTASTALHPPRKLAQVPAITGLLMRRQTRGRVPWPFLHHVLASLPNLESVDLEVWRMAYRNCLSTERPEFGKL